MVIKNKRPATVSFDDTVTVNQPAAASPNEDECSDKKYSLDSDEEDDVRTHGKLRVDDIDGQEQTTRRQEEGQKITPFNLEDEEEEGYFAEDGTFIFVDKDKDEIKDNWLDSIDIYKVPDKAPDIEPARDATPDPLAALPHTEIVEQILSFLKPTETVSKALKRLGGTQLSASQRLKMKKKGENPVNCTADKDSLEKLTSLSDWMLHKGRDTIYQDTFEKLSHEINQASEDIFGDTSSTHDVKRVKLDESQVTTEINWYYKTEGVADGPFCSSDMLKMQTDGVFKAGTKVCKESNREQFYPVYRINFDDYID